MLNVLMAVRHASDGADCTELADILGDRDGENLADAFARVADDAEYAESIRTHFGGFRLLRGDRPDHRVRRSRTAPRPTIAQEAFDDHQARPDHQ